MLLNRNWLIIVTAIIFLVLCFAGIFLAVDLLNNGQRREDKAAVRVEEITSPASGLRVFAPQPLSVERIFNHDHSWTATLSAEKTRVLIATGDVILGRSVNLGAVRRNNFLWPFEKTAEVLRSGDLTFINLEAPLIRNCQPMSEGMSFCGDQRNVEGLVFAGVDVASLANNHMGNYGLDGINQTSKLLGENEILTTGTGGAVIKDIRGLNFAFLGYNDIGSLERGISWAENDKIASEVMVAREQAEKVIVSFHWGTEYTSRPTQKQRDLAHLAIDSGADLIIGNHPHWIQPLEIYKDKLIVYGHGNFVFDQMWSEKTKEGVIGKYTFYDDKLIDAEFLPIVIQDYGQPNFADSKRGARIIDAMREESLRLELGEEP